MTIEVNYKIGLLTATLAFVSMGLNPSLLTSQSVNAASHWCEDRTDSGSWTQDVRMVGMTMTIARNSPRSREYASGYKVSWGKGIYK